MYFPPELIQRWRHRPEGVAWLDELPFRLRTIETEFGLLLGRTFASAASLVVDAKMPSGRPVVVKFPAPDADGRAEAAAIRFWRGRGAPDLIHNTPDGTVLILQRVRPGQSLWTIPEEQALPAVAGLLRSLWIPAPRDFAFMHLVDQAATWQDELRWRWNRGGRPCSSRLVERASSLIDELCGERHDVLLHQDLHCGNVLLGRSTVFAIDPKPLIGERAFDLAPLVRDRRWLLERGISARVLQYRVDYLAEALDVDRVRVAAWAFVHAMVCAFAEDVARDILRCAEMLSTLPAVAARGAF